MTMTQAELNAMLARNPNLKVRGMPKNPKSQNQVAKLLKEMGKTGGSNKYWNIKVYIQEKGITVEKSDPALGKVLTIFDSLKEYARFQELEMLQRAGIVSKVARQVKLVIQDAFVYEDEHIAEIYYRADFVYIKGGRTVVEDVKGYDEETQSYRTTADFKLKWKLLKHRYPDYLFTIY